MQGPQEDMTVKVPGTGMGPAASVVRFKCQDYVAPPPRSLLRVATHRA